MKLEKLTYESAKIDVTVFGVSDIVTASDGTSYVDPDGWDTENT